MAWYPLTLLLSSVILTASATLASSLPLDGIPSLPGRVSQRGRNTSAMPPQTEPVPPSAEVQDFDPEASGLARFLLPARHTSRQYINKWMVVQEWYLYGGTGGGFSLHEQMSHKAVVVKFEAWAGGWQLRGIKVHFSNGQTRMFGMAADRYRGSITIDYAGGESVTEVSLWGNGAGTRCGAFRIKTNKGQDYFPKMYRWGLKTEFKKNIGSGIIVGALGRHGADIDSFGIMMLRKISGVDMINVKYDIRGNNLRPARKISELDVTIANPSGSDSDKGFHQVHKQRSDGGSWSVTAGFTFGQTYKVEGGVPFVTGLEATSTWEVSVSGTYEETWSSSAGSKVSIPLIVPKYSKMRIRVHYFEGTSSNLPYTAQMMYFLDNGYKFYTNINGLYNGVSNSRFIQCSEVVATWNTATHSWVPVPNPKMIVSNF